MMNELNNMSDRFFNFKLIKSICIIMYFVLLILEYFLDLWWLYNIIDSKDINTLYVILDVIVIIVAPFIILILIFPIYALAYLCEKNKRISEEQLVIERMVGKIIVEDMKKDNK